MVLTYNVDEKALALDSMSIKVDVAEDEANTKTTVRTVCKDASTPELDYPFTFEKAGRFTAESEFAEAEAWLETLDNWSNV